MRLRSDIWVKAYLRRCQAEGANVVVVRRGHEQAGAIYISLNRLDGTTQLYGPAPAGLEASESERSFVPCISGQAVATAEAERYLARQIAFDPDLWIIEVEARGARTFLEEPDE